MAMRLIPIKQIGERKKAITVTVKFGDYEDLVTEQVDAHTPIADFKEGRAIYLVPGECIELYNRARRAERFETLADFMHFGEPEVTFELFLGTYH